jgi:kynurenine formamidase
MKRLNLLPCLLLVCLHVAISQAKPKAPTLDPTKLVDLTHAFDERTIYWPNAEPFRWEKERWGKTETGTWYAAARYAASEHGGTHIDSPIHFSEGKKTVDEIAVVQLVAPAVVVDVTAQCERDPDYQISAADIQRSEREHKKGESGAIPAGAIVLFRTGWSRYWPDKKRYMGNDVPRDTAHLHFPGLSRGAAEYLAKKKIVGVGIDTASMDPGTSKDFAAHQVLNGANLYGLENLTDLDRLPETGAWIIALPMKIKGGSGAPTRVVALLP